MESEPINQQTTEDIIRIAVEQAIEELVPHLHGTVERAYASGVRDGVSNANRRKALLLHKVTISEKAKVETDWILTLYGVGRCKSNKKFAGDAIARHRLTAGLKTVQNWVSEFRRT